MSAFSRESDYKARRQLTSHALDFAAASAEAVTCPSGRDPLGTGTSRTQEAPMPPMAQ